MSAAAQMEKMPLAKSRSLKTLSKTVYDKDLCAHKGERRLNASKTTRATIIYTELKNTKYILHCFIDQGSVLTHLISIIIKIKKM